MGKATDLNLADYFPGSIRTKAC